MRALTLLVVAFCFIGVLFATDLSKPCQLTVGQVAADKLNLYGVIAWRALSKDFDAPILAVCDTTTGKIVMTIFGGRNTAEGAKGTMNTYIKSLEENFFSYLKMGYGIELSMDDFMIVYTYKPKGEIILYWEEGEFKMP